MLIDIPKKSNNLKILITFQNEIIQSWASLYGKSEGCSHPVGFKFSMNQGVNLFIFYNHVYVLLVYWSIKNFCNKKFNLVNTLSYRGKF